MNNIEETVEILFFSLEKWDEIWRRNQFLCSYLLERNQECRILWVNPPIDIQNDRDFAKHLFTGPQLNRQNLWTIDLVKPLPNMLGRRLNELLYLKKIQKAVKALKFNNFLIWINDQNMAPIPRMLKLPVTIYDVTDDWTEATLTSRQRATVVANDDWLLRNAKHTIVRSNKLRDLKKAAKNLHLIPNGVEFARYSPSRLAELERPRDLPLKAPLVGYTGTLHEDRLDIDLLIAVSQALPDIEFVFIGPNAMDVRNTQKLACHKNIRILGARPYLELPSYLAHFDACFVPHKISKFTESLDPLKLYEYFATGKPIFSTACAGFKDFPDLVQISENAGQMSRQIKDWLLDGQKCDAANTFKRTTFAQENSWEERIVRIEHLLNLRPRE